MKSMKQMHDALLSKARWDGGWPRPIVVGPGIIALARSQEHYDALLRSSRSAHVWGVVTSAALAIVIVIVWIFAT